MEEALQQLSTNELEYSRRKDIGPSGQITVTMDTRALAPDHRICYRNLHKFRVAQMNEGVDLTDLSDEQWGMVQLDKCHHISTTSTSKDGPQSFRVRICKTCCQEDSHIELGTYVDQESAILVNDTFEILNERLDRLIVLRVEDKTDLQHLVAKKYDRSKGRDYACILELISERISAIEGKKRKPSVSEMIPAFAKRSGELSTAGSSADLLLLPASGTPYSTCSTSSEASDEVARSASRLSAPNSKTLSAANSHASLLSASRPASARRTSSSGGGGGRKLSIGSAQDAMEVEVASHCGSASTIDDDIITVSAEEASAALRELSSVCYQRLLSPSINPTIPDSAHLSPGTLTTGTSLFGPSSLTGGTADLVRSLEKARAAGGSAVSTVSNSSSSASRSTAAAERLNLGSPFSNTSTGTAPLHTILADSPPPASESDTEGLLLLRSGAGTGSTNKRPRPGPEDETSASGTGAATAGGTNSSNSQSFHISSNDRLASLEGLTPRKRAATFSVSEPYPYPYHHHYSAEGGVSNNPIATLTWLASLEECEVDVARSLFELRGNTGTEGASSLFDSRSTAMGMALSMGASGSYGSYMASGPGNEMDDEEGEGDEYYGQDGDEGEIDDDAEGDGGESAYYSHLQLQQHMMSVGGSGRPGSKPIYGFPSTYPHNSKALAANSSGSGAGGGAGPQRVRSSSMSMIDRSEAAWAILGNTGGYRSRMDPLSMALKKYHERGGSANAAACGFVGIYSPEDRKQRILRFLEKRKRRMWTKKVKYDVRKNFADSRVRVKGRFVKKQEGDGSFCADGEGRLNTSHASYSSCDNDASMDPAASCGGPGGDDLLPYDHTDVDLELLDHLNAQQQARDSPKTLLAQDTSVDGSERGMSLKLKLSGRGSGASSSSAKKRGEGARTPTPTAAKSEAIKSEGKSSELKLTISGRRRRNSRVEDNSVGSEAAVPAVAADGTAVAGDHSGSSPSAVAMRMQQASLDSAVKPPPPFDA